MFIIDRGGYTHTMFNFHLGYSVINSAVDIQCSIDLNQSEEEPIKSMNYKLVHFLFSAKYNYCI